MLLTYHGHSEFLLESASGFRVLTDPYDGNVGYPLKAVQADAVLVSHAHMDHAYTQKVLGAPMILSAPGRTRLTPMAAVESVLGFHDDAGGQKRGQTLLSVIEMDGLKIVHLGDLGTALTKEQRQLLNKPDLLLIPVGGYFTIDARAAAEVVSDLCPRVVIPMHYKTSFNRDWPIETEENFLARMNALDAPKMPLLRVTQEDILCVPPVVLLSPT